MSTALERVLEHAYPDRKAAADAADPKAARLYGDGSFPDDQALREFIGDVDSCADWLYAECMGHGHAADMADRALRMPHRLDEAEPAAVFCAALLAATEGDAGECLRAVRALARRWIAHGDNVQRLQGRAAEIAADVADVAGVQ